MRTPLRLAASALVTSVFGLSSAIAQFNTSPVEEKPKLDEARKKEVIEKLDQLIKQQEIQKELDRLLKQIQELEAKKAAEAKKPAQPETPKPVKPEGAGGLQFQLVPGPAADPTLALKMLLMKSTDPKVIGLTRELLALIEKQPAQKPPAPGVPFKFEIAPDGGKPKAAPPTQLELKFEGFTLESRKPTVAVVPDSGKGGLVAPAAGASSLKLSADGKTAAVVGSDGSITIYDVATGKEQLKFPAKK